MVGWTTVGSGRQAHKLAQELITAGLVACVQVDAPHISHYVWHKNYERAKEWRLWVKFLRKNNKAIESWLIENHPYSTPQWLALEANLAGRAYGKWVKTGTVKLKKTNKQ